MMTGKRAALAAALVAGSLASMSTPANAATKQILGGSYSDEVALSAGGACPFVVHGDRTFWTTAKALPGDGQRSHPVGTGTWTNPVTGVSFTRDPRFSGGVHSYDAASNDVHGTTDAQVLIWFYPRDVGPAGVPVTQVETYILDGHMRYTLDLDTNTYTEFTFNGQVFADICAVLPRLRVPPTAGQGLS